MTVLSDKMVQMLNAQAARELGNFVQYTIVSSWFHDRGLKRLAAFFAGEAEGEQGHSKKFTDYLRESNSQIALPAIEQKVSNLPDCDAIANLYLEAESETTQHIKDLWRQSEEDFDIGTQDLLQIMLREQVEEEGLAERFSELVALANGDYLKLDLMFGA